MIQALINTMNHEFDEADDKLRTPQEAAHWLSLQGVTRGGPVAEEAWRDLRDLRELLRALAMANVDGGPPPRRVTAELNALARRHPIRVRFSPEGVAGLDDGDAAGGSTGGVSTILAAAWASMVDGTWSRLKACRQCEWAFYDWSKNRSGRWCAMSVCGNRTKVRAYRARRRTR